MAFKTLEESSNAIKMASADPSLEKEYARLATDDGQMEDCLVMYRDIMQDLDKLKSMLGRVGAPRSAAIVNDAIVKVDSCKAILEEELAKPR
jgi:hypothetical protein